MATPATPQVPQGWGTRYKVLAAPGPWEPGEAARCYVSTAADVSAEAFGEAEFLPPATVEEPSTPV